MRPAALSNPQNTEFATHPPTPTKILYDRKSAAYVLSISVRSLDYLIANKRLNTLKLGSKVMVAHGELLKFSRAHHSSPSKSQEHQQT